MAITIAAAAIRPLNLDHFSCLSPSSSKLSQLSSRQFTQHLGRIQIGNKGLSSRSRRRILPLVISANCTPRVDPMKAALNSKYLISSSMVKAKKQTFSSFDELLANSDKPVLVDFYATWCGPCQFMAPVLNEVSAAMIDKIQVVKIDTEKYPSIADKYRIEALPTFIIFKDGEPYDRFVSGNL
ncbi:hypothetical protein C3L33_22088, partial [Rhododendron williamsianum]